LLKTLLAEKAIPMFVGTHKGPVKTEGAFLLWDKMMVDCDRRRPCDCVVFTEDMQIPYVRCCCIDRRQERRCVVTDR